MALALKGFEGSVELDFGSGASAMGKVTKWSANVDFKESENGPYIGSDGTTEVQTVAKMLKGKLEADIPIGTDPCRARWLLAR